MAHISDRIADCLDGLACTRNTTTLSSELLGCLYNSRRGRAWLPNDLHRRLEPRPGLRRRQSPESVSWCRALVAMPRPGELKSVQARILKYAREIGWTHVPRDEWRRGFDSEVPTSEERARQASLFFGDLLHSQVRAFNPKYKEAEGALIGEFSTLPCRHLRQPGLPQRPAQSTQVLLHGRQSGAGPDLD